MSNQSKKFLSALLVSSLLLSNAPLTFSADSVVSSDRSAEISETGTSDSSSFAISEEPMQETTETYQEQTTEESTEQEHASSTKATQSVSQEDTASETDWVMEVTNYLKATSYETILKKYGGRLTMEQAYAAQNMRLGDLQTGENRSMDSIQLEETYMTMQNHADAVGEKIVDSFEVLSTDEYQHLFDRLDEVLFYYAYTQRWFNYDIGGTHIADVMFRHLSLFSDKETSDLDMLFAILDTLLYDPWPSVPGKPMAMGYFMHYLLFNEDYGMVGQGKGFSGEQFKDAQGRYSIVSLMEFLIDTYGHGVSYDAWFKSLGFVYAEPDLPENVDIPHQSSTLWQLMKNAEFANSNSISPAFSTMLCSVPEKNKFLVTGTGYFFVVGNATKYPTNNPADPQQVVDRYERALCSAISFFWNTGSTDVQANLQKHPGGEYVFDAGEWEGDGLKDVHSTNNPYLHYLMQAAAPLEVAKNMTVKTQNAVALENRTIFSLGNMYNEFTLIHEIEHRLNTSIYTQRSRLNMENTAVLYESDFSGVGNLTLNIGYSDTKLSVWNQKVPDNKENLERYANNILDLIFSMNLIKAKTVFSLPVDQQVGHVQQMVYDGEVVRRKWLTEEDLQTLALDPTQTDFIEHLVKNKLFLPSRADSSLANNNASFTDEDPRYTRLGFRRDSYFYVPYTGSSFMEDYFDTSAMGFNHFWLFASMAKNGWDGVIDFTSTAHTTDKEALSSLGVPDPDTYLIDRYQNVENQLDKNALALDNSHSLSTSFYDSRMNDRALRDEIISKYQTNDQNLMFSSIFNDTDNEAAFWGTSSYTFDEDTGVLTVGAGTLNLEDRPWVNGISATSIKEIVFTGPAKAPMDSSRLFSGTSDPQRLTNLTTITGLDNLDTSETTTMISMFGKCAKLEELDLSNFNTSHVTDMYNMFWEVSSLKQLDLSSFDTSNVTTMKHMFINCLSLELVNLSSFDTASVTDMQNMFKTMSNLTTLILGEQFRFVGTNVELGTPSQLAGAENTGKWTRKDGQSAAYTPADFIRRYGSGDLTAGTYIGEQAPMDLCVDILDNENNLFTIGDTQTLKVDLKPKEIIGNQHAKNILVTIDLNDLPYWQLAASGKLTITGTSDEGSSSQEVEVTHLSEEENKYQLALPDYDPEKTTGFSLEVDGLCTNNVPMKQLAVASQDIFVSATYDSGFTGTTAREVTSTAIRGIQSGRLSFGDLSDVLQFGSESISALPRTRLINRQDSEWSITVTDLRGTNPLTDGSDGQSVEVPRQDWEIVATAAPFMDSEQNVIDPSTLNLVFIEDGITNPLDSKNEVLIAHHSVLDEEPIKDKEHPLQWTDKEGFKVQYNTSSGIQPGRTYTSKLTLDLRSAP